jgi:hypothetical protein
MTLKHVLISMNAKLSAVVVISVLMRKVLSDVSVKKDIDWKIRLIAKQSIGV